MGITIVCGGILGLCNWGDAQNMLEGFCFPFGLRTPLVTTGEAS